MRSNTCVDTETHFNLARDAFTRLGPIREDYPLLPIEAGFNWDECAAGLSIPSLYLVVFRSIRRADADIEMLRHFDDRAFDDARAAPGFLFYFKGQLTPERACLSFCLWRSRAEARSASARPEHVAAAGLVARMYESYDLERHTVRQDRGMLVFERVTSEEQPGRDSDASQPANEECAAWRSGRTGEGKPIPAISVERRRNANMPG